MWNSRASTAIWEDSNEKLRGARMWPHLFQISTLYNWGDWELSKVIIITEIKCQFSPQRRPLIWIHSISFHRRKFPLLIRADGKSMYVIFFLLYPFIYFYGKYFPNVHETFDYMLMHSFIPSFAHLIEKFYYHRSLLMGWKFSSVVEFCGRWHLNGQTNMQMFFIMIWTLVNLIKFSAVEFNSVCFCSLDQFSFAKFSLEMVIVHFFPNKGGSHLPKPRVLDWKFVFTWVRHNKCSIIII